MLSETNYLRLCELSLTYFLIYLYNDTFDLSYSLRKGLMEVET